MNKNVRQKKIIEIVSNQEVDTQEELASILNNLGYYATQATVSRDIKELGLIKISGKERKYMYTYQNRHGEINDIKILNLFKNCVISINVAKNIVVIKTLGGNGNSAGVMVDKLQLKEIVGSVAGDDTVIIVTNSDEDAITVKDALIDLL
ncbi:MAG: arginine repressor [Clostridiales bacterium]|nr:arginine repressor [Clostridiales bacterium]